MSYVVTALARQRRPRWCALWAQSMPSLPVPDSEVAHRTGGGLRTPYCTARVRRGKLRDEITLRQM
jgi:hypothetical protein